MTIRPAPGDAATVRRAAERGLTVFSHPLFDVCPVDWDAPDPKAFDAVLFGSANALRHGGEGLARLTTLPALCVGNTTAKAAQDAGFAVAATGSKGLQSLIPIAEAAGYVRLLRISGEAHVPLAAPAAIHIEARIVYRVETRPIDRALAGRLSAGALVLLHSGAAARHFADACERLGLDRGRIALACLAARVAASAGAGWQAVRVAETPDESALLAVAEQMCQGRLR